MAQRPFRVLAVSSDRELLRSISRFLEVFGFQIETVADAALAKIVLSGQRPDFLIIDEAFEDGALEISRFAMGQEATTPIFTCLLVGEADQQAIVNGVEAGIDDFLTKPLVCGELLARLRCGARVLQFEERVRRQASFDPQTNLLSSGAITDRLHEELTLTGRSKSHCSLIAIGIDLFQHIRHAHGAIASDALLREVAKSTAEFLPEDGSLAAGEPGVFYALLPGQTQIQAQHWASDLRDLLKNCTVECLKDQLPEIATSYAVCAINKGTCRDTPAGKFLEQADAALATTRQSGCDTVTIAGQFDSEQRRWREIATSGQLFNNTVARDVMNPCPIALNQDQPLADAIRLLRQTSLPEIPVVDANERFVGLVFPDLLEIDASPSEPVADHMVTGIRQFDESTSFDDLMEIFATENVNVVAVIRGQTPIGTIRCSQLAALSEPLDHDSFQSSGQPTLTSDYLVVAD